MYVARCQRSRVSGLPTYQLAAVQKVRGCAVHRSRPHCAFRPRDAPPDSGRMPPQTGSRMKIGPHGSTKSGGRRPGAAPTSATRKALLAAIRDTSARSGDHSRRWFTSALIRRAFIVGLVQSGPRARCRTTDRATLVFVPTRTLRASPRLQRQRTPRTCPWAQRHLSPWIVSPRRRGRSQGNGAVSFRHPSEGASRAWSLLRDASEGCCRRQTPGRPLRGQRHTGIMNVGPREHRGARPSDSTVGLVSQGTARN